MSALRSTAAALLLLLACTSQVGDPCRMHSDCKLDRGYCARAEVCTLDCSDGRACPAGSACVGVGPREVCLETCRQDSDCVKGLTCVTAEPRVCMLADPLAKPE